MVKLKKKVQAQRKFAQGAYVPPTSSGALEKRLDPTPSTVHEQSIVHNNISASNLLDVVSFQKLHTHMQLVVLVERLQTEPKSIKSMSSPPKIANDTYKNNKFVTKKQTNKRQRDVAFSMRLRSRTKSVKTKRLLSTVKQKFAKHGIQRQRSAEARFSVDDNRPLKFFTKKKTTRNTQNHDKSGPNISVAVDCEARRSSTECPVTNLEPVVPGPSTGQCLKRSAEKSPVTSQAKISAPSDRTREMETKYGAYRAGRRFQPQSGGGCYREEDIHRWLEDATEIPTQGPCDSENAFKVPETPPKSLECKNNESHESIDIPSPCRALSPMPSETRVESPPTPPSTINRCPPSPCPSERYTTVDDVISAPQCDLDRRCKGCRGCRRVEKVHALTRLIQEPERPRPATEDDVYEFNPENDEAADHVALPKLRQTRTQEPVPVVETTENVTSPAAQGNPSDDLYLDLLPRKSSHVVQITEATVQGRKVLHAILVDKSDEYPNGSLIEHSDLQETIGLEALLEKIFLKLGVSMKGLLSNCKTEPYVDPEVVIIDDVSSRPEEDSLQINTDLSSKQQVAESNRGGVNGNGRYKTGSLKKKSENGIHYHSFPKSMDSALLVDAPVYSPTEEEFQDPISYFEKIMPVSAKFGMCKIIVPPSFKPPCHVTDKMPIRVCNQYIARMYSRWGPAAREMTAIKAYLASQGVPFIRAPLMDGVEVNLPKLYHLVQRHGGLKKVIEKKRWGRIAEEMRLTGKSPEKTIDKIYVKHLLPYDTLSHHERQEIIRKVEKHWNKRHQGMLERAANPLHRQKRLLEESESSADDSDEEVKVSEAFCEAEECVLKGRNVSLVLMKRVGQIQMQAHFPNTPQPLPEEVEKEYWRIVLLGTDHVCVNSASVDTGEEGYGFPKNIEEPYGSHPWNLKQLRENSGNILGSLGKVLGVTVPTLHLGMVFSTSCWHRDPHGLPWMEYMHSGPPKIWYGIPDDQSENFRKAVETLCPTACQNKSIWLPSDIAMIPPNLLREHNVSLSRVEQNAGEFIVVFPKAYSSSICTGYTVSESVYFGTNFWLHSVNHVHQELRESCEPTMFSIEKLLVAIARDSRASSAVLQQVYSCLAPLLREELEQRQALQTRGLRFHTAESLARNRKNKKLPAGAWNLRDQDECEICRTTLYLSKVTGLTGRSSSVCVQHALRLLETSRNRNRPVATLQAITYMTVKEIERSLNLLEKRVTE